MVTKYEFWFDHFQVEFGAHTWRLSSPREYFKMVLEMVELENVYFVIGSTAFRIVNYIGTSARNVVFEDKKSGR